MKQILSLSFRFVNYMRLFANRFLIRWRCAKGLCKPGSAGKKIESGILISYAHESFPRPVRGGACHFSGGAVKYLWLDRRFPHSGLTCDAIYAVSSSHYEGLSGLLEDAKKRGVAIIWNQNGAYFPSAYGIQRAKKGNIAMAKLLHAADYVFYQSQFARRASDFFLGVRDHRCEVLYNAVDTGFFRPLLKKQTEGLVLLLAGSHNEEYRLTLALETLFLLKKIIPNIRLVVAGRMAQRIQNLLVHLAKQLSVEDSLQIIGPYAQTEAPAVYAQAHILLHTQYNDVCPSVVLEAMACGLAIVYSKTGGTPELVGEDAGVGVHTELDWNIPRPPSADNLANAVCQVAESLQVYHAAARERAVTNFDIQPWLERHHEIFEEFRQ